ncbi:MAG: hypothetical protein RLY22_728, partial [Actinomycetota bacterium]
FGAAVFFGAAVLLIGVVSFTGVFATGLAGASDVPDLKNRFMNDSFLAGSWPLALSFPT